MFAQLPEKIQHEILRHLHDNNFVAAKQLRDHWLQNQEKQVESAA